MSQAVLKGMIQRRKGRYLQILVIMRGCIVNIGSVIGLHGNTGQSIYSASKAGLIGLTKSLSKEYGQYAIRVNMVAPGYIQTDMTKGKSIIPSSKKTDIKPAMLDSIISKTSLKRLGNTDDVAAAVLFLESSTYITGQVIVVDGGLQL
jgi:NAD(P)-dependent dehydrogenase (short-subunit alcohol dehydrogenase family)